MPIYLYLTYELLFLQGMSAYVHAFALKASGRLQS